MVSTDKFVEQEDEDQRKLDRDAQQERMFEWDAYAELPMALRMKYTRTEYDWLSDDEKHTLVQRECDPEF